MEVINNKLKISQPFVTTSLIEVTNKVSQTPPCRVFFKNEYEQPSGSFKLRGIGNLVYKSYMKARTNYPEKRCHVYASSGGNAGLAAAYLARYYKLRCTVVLPVVSKQSVRNKLKEYGAETIIYGKNINEADQYLQELIKSINQEKIYPIYCHPFENPLIWEGHSSLVDEIFQEQLSSELAPKVKGVVCSIGGGGLYNGIYQGLKKNKKKLNILLVETKQAPTCTETIKADKLITLNSVNSVATSLACSYLSSVSLDYYKDHSKIKTFVESIDDIESIKGSVDYYNDFGNIVEPACGAAVSTVYNQLELIQKNFKNLHKDDIIVVVVCGGSCTDEEGIQEFKRLLKRQNKL